MLNEVLTGGCGDLWTAVRAAGRDHKGIHPRSQGRQETPRVWIRPLSGPILSTTGYCQPRARGKAAHGQHASGGEPHPITCASHQGQLWVVAYILGAHTCHLSTRSLCCMRRYASHVPLAYVQGTSSQIQFQNGRSRWGECIMRLPPSGCSKTATNKVALAGVAWAIWG